MALVSAAKIQDIARSQDAKTAILKAVGDISKQEVFWDLVLVGTYFRPEKTAGGIIRPHENVREDEFQSKVGLVLKMGPGCPEDPQIALSDWVVYSIKDGWQITLNGTPCRLIPYERIRMKITDPTLVF